ncbi:hypothetical protein HYV50_01115 [Candidatus Pacearchaeota archaeon]|nr:hypothetical protein [Candidatus Pacearchaeota archaeon]
MPNKKAQSTSELLMDNAIYLILLVLFLSTMLFFIWDQMNGASLWAEYYSKEISKVINLAKAGDVITLDVQKATAIAKSNDIKSFSEIFVFDNINNELCVKLSIGRKTCYSYFNNVDIIEPEINYGPPNTLTFKIIEK